MAEHIRGGGPVVQRNYRQIPKPIEGGCLVCCSLWDGREAPTCPRCGSPAWDGKTPFVLHLNARRADLEARGWGWVQRSETLHVLAPPGQQSLPMEVRRA